MRIVGFAQDDGACTNIRIKQPLRKIQELGLAEVDLIEDTNPDIPDRVAKGDIILFGRSYSEGVVKIVRKAQEWGAKVVLDLDDNFFDISPYSPHYKDLGIMAINIDRPDGTSAPMWEDGKNGFDITRNRGCRRWLTEVLRSVNVITVTSGPLQKEYLRFNDRVEIIPNSLDFEKWDRLPIVRTDDKVRLLYTGASNHQEDFFFIKDVLKGLQDRHKNLMLVFLGSDWRVIRNDLDYSRVEWHRWVSIEAYPYLVRSLCCQIGIAPVSKTKFNDCRSALKWKEYSAIGAATVATDYGPYARAIRHGETGFLVNTEREWFDTLSTLVENRSLSETIGGNAYQEVKLKYNLDYVADKWMEIFTEVMNEKG